MSHKILSKNVLGMKFMQRTKEKLDRKKEVEETTGHKVDDDLKGKTPEVQVWPTEESMVPCEGLLFGRMSFRGYNPEVEKLMEEHGHLTKSRGGESSEEEAEVSSKEMAKRYQDMDFRSSQVKRKRQYIERK